MSLDSEARALRALVAALHPRKTQRRYAGPLRARLAAHIHARVAAGDVLDAIARSLDVSLPTVTKLAGRPASALVPVRVMSLPPVPARSLTLRGPCGVVVEGLSLEDVAEMCARLASCSR